MADGRVYLDELNTNTLNYKVKVKVLQKGKPQRSATDVLYQSVVLQDDKGNKMRGTLFGDQIAGHADALVYNGVYEIANAPIRAPQDNYRRNPTELPHTMGFGRQTLIRPLASTPGPVLPEYQCVSEIPKTATPYDIFDAVGILLYAEPASREVTTRQGRKSTVREVVLTDHSTEQPIVVSAWNELAEEDCGKLVALVGSLPVIGFTALSVSTHRGFSLTGTMSTSIDPNPTGAKAVSLAEWVSKNKEALSELQARIYNVRDLNAVIPVLSLSALKGKKATNTLQGERYRLNVTALAPEFHRINAYLGCSGCGKRSDYAAGEVFKCENCTREGVVSEPRVTFNCKVTDGTDQLEITAFTEDTVKLFCMSAPEIFHMKESGDKTTFGKVQSSLKNVTFTIEVAPKTELSKNNILQWALRQVIPSQERLANMSALLPPEGQERDITVGNAEQSAPPVARQLDFGSALKQPENLALVEVAVSSDYTSLRKLPTTITASPVAIQLQGEITKEAVAATQTTTSNIPHADITPTCKPLDGVAPTVIHVPTTSPVPTTLVLKTPKVEKIATSTPETPAQTTPKRNTTKTAAGSPSKKKKAATSSSAAH